MFAERWTHSYGERTYSAPVGQASLVYEALAILDKNDGAVATSNGASAINPSAPGDHPGWDSILQWCISLSGGILRGTFQIRLGIESLVWEVHVNYHQTLLSLFIWVSHLWTFFARCFSTRGCLPLSTSCSLAHPRGKTEKRPDISVFSSSADSLTPKFVQSTNPSNPTPAAFVCQVFFFFFFTTWGTGLGSCMAKVR